MSATAAPPTQAEATAQIAQAKQFTRMGTELFLSTFAAVPDDKLNFSPSPTSKSPLRLAAHVAVSANAFASLLRGEPAPDVTFPEMIAWMDSEETKIATRADAVLAIETSRDAILDTLDAMTPEFIGSTIKTPFGEHATSFIMTLCGLHPCNHASQVDYIQTAYGDMESHFPH